MANASVDAKTASIQIQSKAWMLIDKKGLSERRANPIPIPNDWKCRFTFKSVYFDFGVEDTIDLAVSGENCVLKRRWRSGERWNYEEWTELTRTECDVFFVALAYAMDNPAIMREIPLVTESLNGDLPVIHLVGRPLEWSPTYARPTWSGILSPRGEVMRTSDWATVFPIVRDMFPVPSHDPANSRWQKTTSPAGMILILSAAILLGLPVAVVALHRLRKNMRDGNQTSETPDRLAVIIRY